MVLDIVRSRVAQTMSPVVQLPFTARATLSTNPIRFPSPESRPELRLDISTARASVASSSSSASWRATFAKSAGTSVMSVGIGVATCQERSVFSATEFWSLNGTENPGFTRWRRRSPFTRVRHQGRGRRRTDGCARRALGRDRGRALGEYGVRCDELPLTPRKVRELVRAGEKR